MLTQGFPSQSQTQNTTPPMIYHELSPLPYTLGPVIGLVGRRGPQPGVYIPLVENIKGNSQATISKFPVVVYICSNGNQSKMALYRHQGRPF